MQVEFADAELDRLEVDPRFTAGYAPPLVRAFRKVMGHIRAAQDERDLYASRGFRFEKLKGKRDHQRSIRLNKQWRLILEIGASTTGRVVKIIGIEDYH